MKYNSYDNIVYLTSTEWTNTKSALLADQSYDTAKFYLVDTKVKYIIYNGQEYAI